MHEASVTLKRLAERVLQKGSDLPLALLLELLVPVRKLRDTAATLGLTPKGGFRREKAPAHVLAQLLAEQREAESVDTILRLLLPSGSEPAAVADDDAGAAGGAEAGHLLSLEKAQTQRARDDLERAREAANRARDREVETTRKLQQAEQEVLLLRRELAYRARDEASTLAARDDKDLQRRVHELTNEREGLLAADQALRRQLAHNQSRLRELEANVAELEALLPKGKRRKRPQPEPPPAANDRRFLLPRFLPSFYKSLEGKDRKAVERAIQAVLLFCTEGHAYPGLEVKQLGGQDTWSLRASLGLRVYFRPLPDGDIELLELGDREDQNTTLRRLKDR